MKEWYEVTCEDNFYDMMRGYVVEENNKVITLEFPKFNNLDNTNSTHRVRFYKNQVTYYDNF